MPIAAEITATWLPEKLLSGDGEKSRRLEFILNGVWWEGEDVAEIPSEWKKFLPWKWPQVTEWNRYASDGTKEGTRIDVTPQETQSYSDAAQKICDQYEANISSKGKTKDLAPFTFEGTDSNNGEFNDTDQPKPNEGWLRAFLAEKAIATPPINHALRMAWISATTEVPVGDDGKPTPTFWLPVFGQNEPTEVTPVSHANPRCLKATYKIPGTSDGWSFVIYARAAEVHHGNLVFAPEWISDNDEWLSKFSLRSASLFDLSDWIVEWIESSESAEQGVLKEARKAVIDATSRAFSMIVEGKVADDGIIPKAPASIVRYIWAKKGDSVWRSANKDLEKEKDFTDLLEKATRPELISVLPKEFTKQGGPLEEWKEDETDIVRWARDARAFLDAVRRPESATEIIVAHWLAVGWSEDTKKSIEDVLRKLIKDVPDLRRWALNAERELWVPDPMTAAGGNSEEEISTTVHGGLITMVGVRLENHEWHNFHKFLSDQTATVKDRLFPKAKAAYPAPLPLRIGVDTLDPSTSSSDGDYNDLDSGVLLVIEHPTSNPTRICCLNEVRHKDFTESDAPGQTAPRFLIPSQVVEQDGLRMAEKLLSNESPSLIVSSELIEDSKKGVSGETPPERPPWVYPPSSDYNYPTLIYGQTYRFWCARVTNGGVLPVNLRKAEAEQLVIPKPPVAETDSSNYRDHTHLRRSLIGPIRFCDEHGNPSTEAPFKIPGPPSPPRPLSQDEQAAWHRDRRIEPLAAELPEWKNDGEDEKNKNLLILFPKLSEKDAPAWTESYNMSSAEFHVCKPATTVWDWIAWQDRKSDEIKRVLDKDKGARDTVGINAFEPPAEPAVEDTVYVELETLWPSKAKCACVAKLKNDVLKVIVKRGGLAVQLHADSGQVEVTGLENAVYRLRIHSLVKKALFDHPGGKFHSFMSKKSSVPVRKVGEEEKEAELVNGDCFAFAPVEVWIEVPPVWKPDPRADDSLKVTHENSEERNKRLGFDATTATSVNLTLQGKTAAEFAWCKRVDIWHQEWFWNGRETDIERDVTSTELDGVFSSSPDAWIPVGFGHRADSERAQASRRLPLLGSTTTFELFSHELVGDAAKRASVHRMRARFYSRYEAFFGDKPIEWQEDIGSTKKRDAWVGAVVPANFPGQLPRPTVRFPLPLTSDVFGSRDVASIMLVLDDPWFAQAGLAEKLDVEVRIVKDPKSAQEYLNAGYDPTLTGAALGPKSDSNSGAIKVRGPYGFTYDYAARTPKLVQSAFVIDVPSPLAQAESESKPTPLPFFLCQIRVQRSVRSKRNGDATKNQPSDWSAPFWVQFAQNTEFLIPPAAEHNEPLSWPVNDWAKVKESLRGFDAWFTENFEQWIVLSREIRDIGGRDTELPVGIFQPDGKVLFGDLPKAGPHFARIMTVRKPRPPSHTAGDTSTSTPPAENSGPKGTLDVLFGSAAQENDENLVPEDPERALPLVSPRFRVSLT